MKVTISKGNSKMGAIPSVSLPPVVSCPKNVPCSKDCYALKSFRMYPNVRTAWEGNYDAWKTDSDGYFDQIRQYLAKHSPRFFRFHVAGDIPDQGYLDSMVTLARKFPNTKILAFTKNHTLDFKRLPQNLSIVFSCWPIWPLPKSKSIPRAFMQDGSETRIPATAIECHGNCESCGMCWNLKSIKRDVYFIKH